MTRDRGVGRAVGAPLGAVAWVVGTVQFFVAHLIAQSAWSPAYSWTANNISDLGNVDCGRRGDPERYICSPLHGWISGSFVVHGLLIIVGAWLLHRAGFHLVASRMAAVLPTGAGLGWIGVGLAPADVAAGAHFVAAAAGLVCGFVQGVVGLAATALFGGGQYLGLGMGGMERVAAFEVTLATGMAGLAAGWYPGRCLSASFVLLG
jgi:hypothetical membrane protein